MGNITNRDVLLRTASTLFRKKGYHGVGLTEILEESRLPKGSLYYHFPGGKRELAEAATFWVGRSIIAVVDKAFDDVDGFEEGAAVLSMAIARLIPQDGQVLACPVASILQASVDEPELRVAACQVLSDWAERLVHHASRLGHAAPRDAADLVLMQLEGAWILALAHQSAHPFERLAVLCSVHAST